MRGTFLVGLLILLPSVALGQDRAAGGLPSPSSETPPPAFGFQPVENQPRLPEPLDLLERPNPNELPRSTATLPPPAAPGAYSAEPTTVPEPGLELRRRGDPTVQGRLPRVRRYGDLAGRPPAE